MNKKIENHDKKENGDSAEFEGSHVFLVIWKTYRALLARADASRKRLGLCDSDFRVLEALLHKGPLPVNNIGQKVDLTTGSITAAVDRLELKNLVVRKNDPNDRRVRLVQLTPKGRRLSEKMYVEHQKDMESAAQALGGEERAVLINLLKRLGKGSASIELLTGSTMPSPKGRQRPASK